MTRLAPVALLLLLSQQQQPPTIRSGVELVMVDVQVTGRDGAPVTTLRPEQFEINIDGKVRPVSTLQLVSLTENATSAASPAAVPATSTPEGRTIILGIDQASIQIPSEPAAREVVTRLLAMLPPQDRVGLVAYPGPGVRVAPTTDRAPILSAATKIAGLLQIPRTRMNIALAEAADVMSKDREALQRLVARECRAGDSACAKEVEMTCMEVSGTFEMMALRSISGLHSLMDAVREYPGRKTVILVSAGFASNDRAGGRPDVRLEADILGKKAAEASAVIYSLHMDVNFLVTFSAANAARGLQTVFRNGQMLANGLERFTGSAGGTLITVPAGPDAALKRVLRETSAYYLLGVESTPDMRDGKNHRITVKVKQGGTSVRARSSVYIPKPSAQ